MLFFVWGIIGFMGKMEVTRQNKKIAENKVAELQQEKIKLSSDIAKLKTEGGVEESIRLKFGLAKEGEGLIVVVDDKNSQEEAIDNFSNVLSKSIIWIPFLVPNKKGFIFG